MKEAQETRKRLSHSSLDMRTEQQCPLGYRNPATGEGRKEGNGTNGWGEPLPSGSRRRDLFHCVLAISLDAPSSAHEQRDRQQLLTI